MGLPLNFVTVIPVKAFDEGKSRLAVALAAHDRVRLCMSMLDHTLGLLDTGADAIVVSGDAGVAAICGDRARWLPAPAPDDLNAALAQARAHVASGRGMLVLPTDLMLLGKDDLRAFAGRGDSLRIARDEAGTGTNLLYLPPAAVPQFRFAFGAGSLAAHVREAERIGFGADIVYTPATALDVDTPADFEKARA